MAILTAEPPRPAPSAPLAGHDRRPHAVVIGAGLGGLAAAIRLGARGWRVTVLERGAQAGGRAGVRHEGGHTFDQGPTIVTAPFLLEELWRLAGARLSDDVDLRPLDPFYRIRFDDGATFAYSGDPDRQRAEVARFSPNDVPGWERFMAASAALMRTGFEELGSTPFLTPASMLRTAPALLRAGAWRSVHGLVARHLRDPRLRTVFSFHPLLIGGDPFAASAIYALVAALEQRWGVHWAMGGTHTIVAGMVRLIERQGGSVRTGCTVAEILVRDGQATGVRLEDGETLAARVVVSNADSVHTLTRLLPPGAPGRWSALRTRTARASMGLFLWHFGTDRQWPEVGHHTILLGPRYRELLRDIFRRGLVPGDPSLYLHRPTASDPAMGPPGRDTFYVLAPVPHLGHGADWTRLAEPFRAAIQARLEATVLPGLGRHVTVSRTVTPIDFRDRHLAWQGSGFGLEPVLSQSAYFRPHNRNGGVRNLYLVGAGTHPGAGIPGVLCSARALDALVPEGALVG